MKNKFVYTQVPKKLPNLFGKIKKTGVPDKATVKWIKSIGFTSSNDASLLRVLKFIGFVDPSGIPTERWAQYRGVGDKEVLAEAVRTAYADLFRTYPNACGEDDESLLAYIRENTKESDQLAKRMLSTFRALCNIANIEIATAPNTAEKNIPVNLPTAGSSPASEHSIFPVGTPTLHIDFQIHISPDMSDDKIELIFKSISKYIFNK